MHLAAATVLFLVLVLLLQLVIRYLLPRSLWLAQATGTTVALGPFVLMLSLSAPSYKRMTLAFQQLSHALGDNLLLAGTVGLAAVLLAYWPLEAVFNRAECLGRPAREQP